MIETQVVESLPSFLTLVSKFSKKWKEYWFEKLQAQHDLTWAAAWLPWFRGEDSAAWLPGPALQPKSYRYSFESKLILDLEAEMRVEFRRRGGQLITERAPVDKWEWYFLMQHHGAPTRLLDWSDAALVGLYFAVSKRGRNGDSTDADAAVYMLDPWWLNEQAFKEVSQLADEYRSLGPALPDWNEAKPYLTDEEFDNDELGVKCPLAIVPSHFLRRLAAQRSCFTIFGREKDGLKLAAESSDAHLVKFT
jgi:FRG domain